MEKSLDTLWPLFARLPTACADWVKTMLDQSQELHASLGKLLPPTLVERLATFWRLTQSWPPSTQDRKRQRVPVL